MFAGLIDVQDRSFQNRSYTTGHKSFRARATVELGEAIGWERAHDVLYAGALDIAVGPLALGGTALLLGWAALAWGAVVGMVVLVRVLRGARDVPAQFGAADENR